MTNSIATSNQNTAQELTRCPTIVRAILRQCDPRTLLACLRVNKLFHQCAARHAKRLYFNITLGGNDTPLDLQQLAAYSAWSSPTLPTNDGDQYLAQVESRESPSHKQLAALGHTQVLTLYAHNESAYWYRSSYHAPLGDILPNVRTCRVVNDVASTRDHRGGPWHDVKICGVGTCPWLEGVQFSKVVYHTLGRCLIDLIELKGAAVKDRRYTFFIPRAGEYREWTPLHHSWDRPKEDWSGRFPKSPNGMILGPDTLPEWIASHNENGYRVAKTIVFGPPRTTDFDAETIAPLGRPEPPLTLDELKELLLWSTSHEVTMVYGLARVKVVATLDSRNWWIRDQEDWRKDNSYITPSAVQAAVSELAARVQPRNGDHFCFASIEDYLKTNPVDELFEDELDSHSTLSKSGWNYFMEGGLQLREAARVKAWLARKEKLSKRDRKGELATSRAARRMAKAESKRIKQEERARKGANTDTGL